MSEVLRLSISPEPAARLRRPAAVRLALAVLTTLLAVGAVYGGIGLLAHDAIGMAAWWLVDSPFSSWSLPGLALLAVIAVPMAAAAYGELRACPWSPVATLAA